MTDTRDVDLTFAASDCLAFLAPEGTAKPTDFADLGAPWICLGWVTQDGSDDKMNQQTKDLLAAGSIKPIRTIFTASTETVDFTFEEAVNPAVRALYDDVPIATLSPTSGVVAYDLPNVPSGNRYALVYDSMDGGLKIRDYAGHVMVTARGDDKRSSIDYNTLQMTFTKYPGPGNTPAGSRLIDFGTVDVSRFF